MTDYEITLEKFAPTYREMVGLYQKHYSEMCERLESVGIKCSPYNPRLEQYAKASDEGWMLLFIVRHKGVACGHCNIYLTNDMHNSDLIAQEDTIYIDKSHRGRGIGIHLIKTVHNELKSRGVKRLNITTGTDLKVAKLLERMGYKHSAHAMTLTF